MDAGKRKFLLKVGAEMAKCIDREKFKEKYLCCGYLPEMSEDEFDAFPTADVRPEKHGYWIPNFDNAADEKRGVAMKYKCSECGNTEKDETYSHAMDYEFCPRCGAKMDGKDGESNV